MSLREHVARAIYHAAYDGYTERRNRVPSPGWCWEQCGSQQRQFALRQADAAIAAVQSWESK